MIRADSICCCFLHLNLKYKLMKTMRQAVKLFLIALFNTLTWCMIPWTWIGLIFCLSYLHSLPQCQQVMKLHLFLIYDRQFFALTEFIIRKPEFFQNSENRFTYQIENFIVLFNVIPLPLYDAYTLTAFRCSTLSALISSSSSPMSSVPRSQTRAEFKVIGKDLQWCVIKTDINK